MSCSLNANRSLSVLHMPICVHVQLCTQNQIIYKYQICFCPCNCIYVASGRRCRLDDDIQRLVDGYPLPAAGYCNPVDTFFQLRHKYVWIDPSYVYFMYACVHASAYVYKCASSYVRMNIHSTGRWMAVSEHSNNMNLIELEFALNIRFL